jgi:hypothetical protein
MRIISLSLYLIVAFISQANSQRYLNELFTDVNVNSDVVYGVNATVIAYSQLGQAVAQPLTMDVYTPSGDTETSRPLILYFHTGNFLPTPQNGSPNGTKTDLNVVEICTRSNLLSQVRVNLLSPIYTRTRRAAQLMQTKQFLFKTAASFMNQPPIARSAFIQIRLTTIS